MFGRIHQNIALVAKATIYYCRFVVLVLRVRKHHLDAVNTTCVSSSVICMHVCVSLCRGHEGVDVQKRLNRTRCRLEGQICLEPNYLRIYLTDFQQIMSFGVVGRVVDDFFNV